MTKKKNKKSSFIEQNKKQLIAVAIALVVLLGGTYAWLQITLNGTKTVKITAGTLSLEIKDENELTIPDAVPTADGSATDSYTFKLKNNGSIASNYTIYLDNATLDLSDLNDEAISESEIRMGDSIVKYSLTKDTSSVTSASTLTTDTLDSGEIAAGATYEYELKLWISSAAETSDVQISKSDGSVVGKRFAKKIRIVAAQKGMTS